MAAFSDFQPLVPDEECLQVNNAMSADGGTAYADDGVGFRIRPHQQSNEAHFSVLSSIGHFGQTDSSALDQEENSEARESGILIRFVEGGDTMYGAPNACSTGLSFLQPEIIDTVNSLMSRTIMESAAEEMSHSPGFSMAGMSPLSQYTFDSSSSAESLSRRSSYPRTTNIEDSAVGAGHRTRREEAAGMCSSDDGKRDLQQRRTSEGMFNESLLSQYPCSSYGSDLSKSSGFIQDFDTLIQGSAGGDIKASHLTVVDAFPGVRTSASLPQFTVIDAFVGDTETNGSRQVSDRPTELSQFTIVDTFVGDGVPGNLTRHGSSGQLWADAQFDVVDAVVGSLGRSTEEHPRDERLAIAECRTLESAEEDNLRQETPPLYPITSVETFRNQGVASVAGLLHMTAGLKTCTYENPEPGDLQQIAVSSTARSAASSVTTFPESGDFKLFATTSVAKSVEFHPSLQLMSGDKAHTVATSMVLPTSQQLMSGDLPLMSQAVSSSRSQVNVTSDAMLSTPHDLQQPLASNVSYSNSTFGGEIMPSSVQGTKVNLPHGVGSSQCESVAGSVPDGVLPRIPVGQDLDLQGTLADIQQKQVWMQLQFDQEISELRKTISPPMNPKPVLFTKPSDSLVSGYQNSQWVTLQGAETKMPSELVFPQSGGLPFDVNRTEDSLRLSMDVLQMSIGDTLIHTGRAPLGSSTPIAREDKLSVRRLQAMQTIQDSEERSDSGRASRASTAASADPETEPGKREIKSGSDVEYMPAEERRMLLEPNIFKCFEKGRAADRENEERVLNQNDAVRFKNIDDRTTEAEECSRTLQSRSGGVGEELKLRSDPKSSYGFVCGKVEDQRNVEVEWVERRSGKRSRTASSSGCSLGDSAPDFKTPMEHGHSEGIYDRMSDHSGSFEDLRLTYQRREPLGEEQPDVKASSQVLPNAVEVEERFEEQGNSERNSCSDGSDVEKVHQLYLSCLRDDDDEDGSASEEGNDKLEDMEGEKEVGKQEEEHVDKPCSANHLAEISESREDVTEIQLRNLFGVKQKSDVKPLLVHGGSAVVFSDSDSLTSSLPRSSRSGSDIEDGLSEDVKRILAKYGRRFSSLKEDNREQPEAEIIRKPSDGKLDWLDNKPSRKVEEGEEVSLSNRIPKSEDFQLGDFHEKVSAGPNGLSNIRSENVEKSINGGESSVMIDQTVESSGESSDDTLGRRVNKLLAKTDRVLGRMSEVAVVVAKSPSRHSSVGSSLTGSVDYGVLQKDLNELEMSLDSMKKGDFVSRFPESKTTEQMSSTRLATGAEVDRSGSRGLHLLLTSGLVPVDLALDMMHGCTEDLSDDGGADLSSRSALGRLGVSQTAQDSLRMKINNFDDKSDFAYKTNTQMEENERMSDAFTRERAVTTESGFSASQSCLTDHGKSKTLEATMEEWSQNRISSFPDMSLPVGDDGRSRSRGSVQENVMTQRGSSRGLRSDDSSWESGYRDSAEANVTLGRGSNSFRESVSKNHSADVGHSSEMRNASGAADGKDNQSSGYSGSGSLPKSEASLGFRVAKADHTSELSLKTFMPSTTTGRNGESLRPVHASVSPIERTVELKSQLEAKKNLMVNKNIGKDSYFVSSLDCAGSNSYEERGVKEDARTAMNFVSGCGEPFSSQSNRADSAPYQNVPHNVRAGFLQNQLKRPFRESDFTATQQRASRQDSELSGVQKHFDHCENENLSNTGNETSFSESTINNNENNVMATPVSDIHELDSFEDAELAEPISAVRVHRAKLKHRRTESTGQPIESSDGESQEGEWTEQFLEPDEYYLSESMLQSCDDDLSGSFAISPIRKHSPFRASQSVQLLLAAQLNRAKVSNYETGLWPLKSPPVTGDTRNERGCASGRDFDNVSGDSSGTLVVNNSTMAADETLKPAVESPPERSQLKLEGYLSDHDSHESNSHEEQSTSSAIQHTSLTTVTSLRDSSDGDNNLILGFPTRSDNRPPSVSPPTIVPYRPVNSRDVYYVDSGTDDGSVSADRSEATVESTHTGSDDAQAPHFPSEVLGTRSDAPMDAMRSIKTKLPTSISRPTDLSTIEELSVVQTSNSDRPLSENSTASKLNHLMEKSRKKEFEQSLEKTKNWVNGISSSLPDMCTPSKAHRDSLCSLSDSNIPVRSRDNQATGLPPESTKAAGGKPLYGQQIRRGGNEVDSRALVSRVDEISGNQLKKGHVEKESNGVTVSTTLPNVSSNNDLSRAIEENRPLPSAKISTELGSERHYEPCSIGSSRDKPMSELRSSYFENGAKERTVDPESFVSSAALDHFVSDRFAGRFESHYGLMPGVQSIVEQYADETDTKREVEDELNKTHTVHESPFRSSKDLSAAGDSVQWREQTEQRDLLPSKSLDSSQQMTSLTQSSMNHVSKSRSNTSPGQVAEALVENTENVPQSSSRFSKDAFVSRLWEKYHESGASSSSESETSRRAEMSALQLVSLVNNPVKHIVKHLQREREDNQQGTETRETRLDRSGSHSRVDEGTSLRSADSYQTYIMDTARPWDLAREAAAGKDGERPSGSRNTRGTSRKGAGDQTSSWTGQNGSDGKSLGLNGAGEKSSSDDEYEERKFMNDDFGKAELLKKLLEKEEREKRKYKDGRSVSSKHQQQTVSKRAWIIQDVVLPVVPENETVDSVTSEFTSSSVDESGKVVTRTTKRHLPGDPKLLKLQQKIARQKEKYKQAYVREHRRKEKIAQMEQLYHMKQNEAGVEQTNIGSSLESFSQPPSMGFDSTRQNMTSDNSALCFNCSETDGSACVCLHLKSKHPALQPSLPEGISHGIKMRRCSPTKKRVGRSAPVIALELREVDYSEEDRVSQDEPAHSKRVHASHPTTFSSPRRSGKVLTKSSPKKMSHASPDGKTPSFFVPREGSHVIVSSEKNDPNLAVPRKLKSKSVDFGMNFPTPRDGIRKSLRSKGVQTTPRFDDPATPLDPRSSVSERRSYRGSRPYDVGVISIPVTGRVTVKAPRTDTHASHGTFTTEARDHEWHLQTRSKVKSHRMKPRKSYPRGISWFIPLKKSASSKSQQPLRYTDLYEMRYDALDYSRMVRDNHDKENTAHLDHSGTTIVKESSMDFVGMRAMHKESAAAVLRENAKNFQNLTSSEIFPGATEGFVLTKGGPLGPSLQDLFRSNMQAFISRSREREKHIALRAEERRIQELHAKERLQLFGSISRGSSVLHADPGCERLFKPRKRWFTKQQMKMMTNRRYRNLPEVMKMIEQKQKTERFQANRQRVQMFKQKILSHVLSEKNRRTAA